MKDRIETLDIAKGFAIILVVFFHCAYNNSYLKMLAGGFHLPLFFIVSGMLYGITGRKITVKNKIFKFIALYIVVEVLLLLGAGRITEREAIVTFVTFKGNSPVWYLPCFLVVLALFSVIERICKNRDFAILLYVLIGMIGLFFPYKQVAVLIRCLVGVLFFAIGYYLHDVIIKTRTWYVVLTEFVMYLIFTLMNGSVDLWGAVYFNQLLYLVNSLLGMHVCIQCSAVIDSSIRFTKFKELISLFGNHSLFILCTHWVFVGIVQAVEPLILGNPSVTAHSRIVSESIGVCRFAVVIILNYLVLLAYTSVLKKRRNINT